MVKKIVAHRGGTEFFHENTLEAYNKAIIIGADLFEIDLRLTKDKQLVCFHDPVIQEKNIADITYAELNEMTDFYVPLFREALETIQGKIKLFCEIKDQGYEKEVVKLLKKYLNYDEYYINSFKDDVLNEINKLDNKIQTGLIIGHRRYIKRVKDIRFVKRMKECNANIVLPHYKYLRYGIQLWAHFKKIPVYAWIVNDTKLIKSFLKNRFVTGIITDRPKKALELLSTSSNRH